MQKSKCIKVTKRIILVRTLTKPLTLLFFHTRNESIRYNSLLKRTSVYVSLTTLQLFHQETQSCQGTTKQLHTTINFPQAQRVTKTWLQRDEEFWLCVCRCLLPSRLIHFDFVILLYLLLSPLLSINPSPLFSLLST